MTTTTTNAAATTEGAVAKGPRASFYTRQDFKGTKVAIWAVVKTAESKEGTPDFEGTIGETRVAGYVKTGPKASFISFIDSKAGKNAEGNYTQVGTANVFAGTRGYPSLSISMVGQPKGENGYHPQAFADCSTDLSQDFLVSLGLDLDKLAANKASFAASKTPA